MRSVWDAVIFIAKVFALGVGGAAALLLVVPWIGLFFRYFFEAMGRYYDFIHTLTS